MIRFAAMLAALPRDPNALPLYLQAASEADRTACLALLNGQRPRRIARLDTLLVWAAEIAEIPGWLAQTSLEASGDRAETAALLLPPPTGTPPTLAETLHALHAATPITAHRTLATLWSRLPPGANLILNRLASGTFRNGLPTTPEPPSETPHRLRAVMVLLQPAAAEITLALHHEGALIPIAKAALALPETAEILAWTRAHALGRFGPVAQVPAEWVFELEFDAITPNRRRKSGYDLKNPRLAALHRSATAHSLSDLHDLLPPP